MEKFQIVVGVIVSVATALIGWKTFELSASTESNNTHLKAIEQQLAETRFGFERIRDVYDRTERYLASTEQNESRGRVLVVLINSLPDSSLRSELLSVVTLDAKSNAVAARAADLKMGNTGVKSSTPHEASFFGDRSLRIDSETYKATTVGEFGFVDSKGISWTVPKGRVVNGASVPRTVWPILGAPLSSDYTIPIILRDYYAEIQTRPWQDVNRMFSESLLKAGVNQTKAAILYQAVVSFGPRWESKPPQ